MAIINGTSGNDFLSGTPSPDQMFGFAGSDSISGANANDVLNGNQQNDILFGDRGPDLLYGGQNEDSLNGGDGDDTLSGDGGFDTLRGGIGRDLFVSVPGTGSDIFADFTSGEDRVGVLGSGAIGPNSASVDSLSVASDGSAPYFLELKQEGKDLLIGDSRSEEYMARLEGLGDLINDPMQLLPSIQFSNFEPSPMLLEAEAGLIQSIEQLKAEGGDPVLLENMQAALSELQGHINGTAIQQAQEVDDFLISESPLPGTKVFIFEEGTVIPLELQDAIAGDEIFFVPNGYFTGSASESLF